MGRFNGIFFHVQWLEGPQTKCLFPKTTKEYYIEMGEGLFFDHFTLGRPGSGYQFRNLVQLRWRFVSKGVRNRRVAI